MRIIGGEARGRSFKTREGNGTRPTDSRAREALFNMMSARVPEARFLDLYAGSGGVGLEALSRGAQSCIFVEQNAHAAGCIKDNVRTLGFSERAQVWTANVSSSVARLEKAGTHFDIIFIDPPFLRPTEFQWVASSLDKCARLLHNVSGQNSGLLVVQHHWKSVLNDVAPFTLTQQRRAGESMLTFLEI
ncbi:MAG TPA: 16S rRNA (guanine(966)-N(2))-methyltransferase RsmD [Abditibacteriaceae bacterium]|jgi:16S rRNA (guanine(966)-N(2))-methyltransferase RsmD